MKKILVCLSVAAICAPPLSMSHSALAQYAYAPRENILEGHPACSGYTVENYVDYFAQNADGPDVQMHSYCAAAYNYYSGYLNAIRQGYSRADSDKTYAAFKHTAELVIAFYDQTR